MVFDIVYQPVNSRRRVFHVPGSDCVVGRSRAMDLSIDSRSVAKRHAEFVQKADGVYVKDLGSSSGTYVNQQRVVDYGPLHELDIVSLGNVSIALQKIQTPESMRASSAGVASLAGSASDEMVSLRSVPFGDAASDALISVAGGVAGDAPGGTSSAISHGCVRIPENDAPVAIGLSEAERLRNDLHEYWGQVVHERLLDAMDLRRKDVSRMSDEQLWQESDSLIAEIISTLRDDFPADLDVAELHTHVLNESVGLGPLEAFLADDSISEIMVNNHREIFIERDGRLELSPTHFSSDKTVYSVIERIITPLGRRLDESSPIVDARLKDGSRVNAVIPPLALKGPSLTIRKFPRHRLDFATLEKGESLSRDMVDFLQVCVEQRRNIVVSGGTGSGKTTLLNLLSSFIPHTQRIVTIEDAAELKLDQPNLVALESRPPNSEGTGQVTIRDLMKNALRMRPDRIVVGECRGGEAIDMLQAMNTGHNGSLTTVHANTPRDVVSRLEVLVLMGGIDIPIAAIREQIASAVDVIIQQNRLSCGKRKITQITEVVGVESNTIQLQEIFSFKNLGIDNAGHTQGHFQASGFVPMFYETLRTEGINLPIDVFQQDRDDYA